MFVFSGITDLVSGNLLVVALLAITVIIALYLCGKLLNSYPLVIAGAVVAVCVSVFSLMQDLYLFGVMWLIFSLTSVIFGFFHFYKNRKGAFWWTLGSVIALLIAAVPFDVLLSVEENTARLIGIIAPIALFFLFGIIGGIVYPRVKFKDKNERKHLTNVDPIIGQKIKVIADKDGEFPARGVIGDVDWSIAAFMPGESFKVGDVVKVKEIKGVTLLVVRDGKDLRSEMKKNRKAAKAAKKEEKPAVVEEVKPVVVEEPKPVEEPTPAPAPVKEKAEFVPFAKRMKAASPELKQAYNELKSEVLSYGIKSRVSSTGDTFRLHTKEYVKMVIAGKTLKLYLALNPRDYRNTTIPFEDASKMSAHKETPFVFKIKSNLSVRRAKVLIADAAKKDGLVQGEVVAHNHAKDVK